MNVIARKRAGMETHLVFQTKHPKALDAECSTLMRRLLPAVPYLPVQARVDAFPTNWVHRMVTPSSWDLSNE